MLSIHGSVFLIEVWSLDTGMAALLVRTRGISPWSLAFHSVLFHSRRRFLLPSSQFGAKYNKRGTRHPFVYFGKHYLNVTDMLKKAFKDLSLFFSPLLPQLGRDRGQKQCLLFLCGEKRWLMMRSPNSYHAQQCSRLCVFLQCSHYLTALTRRQRGH